MKWIIVFYQIVVALPEGEITFSGLDLGYKFINKNSILSKTYNSKIDCEEKLSRFRGKNKIKEVDTFYSKRAKIVTGQEPLSDNERVIVNAFQCIRIL